MEKTSLHSVWGYRRFQMVPNHPHGLLSSRASFSRSCRVSTWSRLINYTRVAWNQSIWLPQESTECPEIQHVSRILWAKWLNVSTCTGTEELSVWELFKRFIWCALIYLAHFPTWTLLRWKKFTLAYALNAFSTSGHLKNNGNYSCSLWIIVVDSWSDNDDMNSNRKEIMVGASSMINPVSQSHHIGGVGLAWPYPKSAECVQYQFGHNWTFLQIYGKAKSSIDQPNTQVYHGLSAWTWPRCDFAMCLMLSQLARRPDTPWLPSLEIGPCSFHVLDLFGTWSKNV